MVLVVVFLFNISVCKGLSCLKQRYYQLETETETRKEIGLCKQISKRRQAKQRTVVFIFVSISMGWALSTLLGTGTGMVWYRHPTPAEMMLSEIKVRKLKDIEVIE